MEKSPLTVVRTKEINRNTPPSAVSTFLDRLPKTPIDHNSWPAFSYKPQVLFSIAHCNDCILIRYEVQEKTIRAVHNQPNAPVYTDSCVEFFIQPVAGQGYYNFEFNCIGASLSGFGKERNERLLLSPDSIRRIKYQAVIHNRDETPATIRWELTVMIPVELFSYHAITSLTGMRCSANFYKCGDNLPDPHYLSWSPIDAPQPDFHQPAFFGPLYFE